MREISITHSPGVMQTSVGDIKQYYGTLGALFIRCEITVGISRDSSHQTLPFMCRLNWIILSLISVILRYLIYFNSSKVLSILDQIICKSSFGVMLDVLQLQEIFVKSTSICSIFIFSICPSTWSCCPPLGDRRCALHKG